MLAVAGRHQATRAATQLAGGRSPARTASNLPVVAVCVPGPCNPAPDIIELHGERIAAEATARRSVGTVESRAGIDRAEAAEPGPVGDWIRCAHLNWVFLRLLLEESGHHRHNLGPCVPAPVLAEAAHGSVPTCSSSGPSTVTGGRTCWQPSSICGRRARQPGWLTSSAANSVSPAEDDGMSSAFCPPGSTRCSPAPRV
jgi:hypothetical protein